MRLDLLNPSDTKNIVSEKCQRYGTDQRQQNQYKVPYNPLQGTVLFGSTLSVSRDLQTRDKKSFPNNLLSNIGCD